MPVPAICVSTKKALVQWVSRTSMGLALMLGILSFGASRRSASCQTPIQATRTYIISRHVHLSYMLTTATVISEPWDPEAEAKQVVTVDRAYEASRGDLRRQAQEWAGLKVDPAAELFVFVGRWSVQKVRGSNRPSLCNNLLTILRVSTSLQTCFPLCLTNTRMSS